MTLEEFIKSKPEGYNYSEIEYNGHIFGGGHQKYVHYIFYEYNVVYYWEDDLPITIDKLKTVMQYAIDNVKFCCNCLNKIEGESYGGLLSKYCKDCWEKELQTSDTDIDFDNK